MTFYGGTTESNQFGTKEFFDLAELLGAQPYLNINTSSLGPTDAARWLEYITSNEHTTLANERRKNGRNQPWKLKYVGIGNEAWGCGGSMRVECAVDVSRRFATFLDGPPDRPALKIVNGPSANLNEYREYLDKMLADDGSAPFYGISLHYYTDLGFVNSGEVPNPLPALGFKEDEWATTLSQALKMELFLGEASAIMDRRDPDKKIALSVDEWGSWHSADPGSNPNHLHQQSSLLDAEVAALTLNILHRHTDRVKLANNSEMVNAIDALVLTDGAKAVLTPVYYVFDMYKPFKGARPLKIAIERTTYKHGELSLPAVDLSAAVTPDVKTILSLVNLDPHNEATVSTNLRGQAEGRILTGAFLDSHNTFEQRHNIEPKPFRAGARNDLLTVELPPKSVVVLEVTEPQTDRSKVH